MYNIFTSNRYQRSLQPSYGTNTTRHEDNERLIPFEFEIPLAEAAKR